METQTLMRLLDLAGIGVFALSGALMAVRLRQTLVTAGFFALVTGVGGGSVRDLLIGAPVFWVQDGAIAAMCIAIALIVWITPERWWRGQLLEWADAVGLAGYAVRSEEHTSELQSLMRISYAVFCLKKKKH